MECWVILKRTNQWGILIPKRELPKVRALVLAHMHSSMLHKCLVANLSPNGPAGLLHFVSPEMFNSRR
jgi:hypothetical protein